MPTDDSQALLERARTGDRAALEELLEHHEARIYRFGMRMCRDPEDAKDVLQETLLTMARRLHDFRGASSISTWLYAVARSFCSKKRRRGKHARDREESFEGDGGERAEAVADDARSPEDALAGKEIESVIQEAISSLEPTSREILILRDAEGLTAPEVAEVLGLSVDAVKSRLHRARLAVRARLVPALGIPVVPQSPARGCPDVLEILSRHLEGEIEAQACAEMERHLEGCARCRGACDSLKRTLALCRSAGASTQVPAAVQASVKAALRELLAAPA